MLIEDCKPGMYIKFIADNDCGVITKIDDDGIWTVWVDDDRHDHELHSRAHEIELIREDEYLAAVLAQG